LIEFQPKSKKTNFTEALKFLSSVQKKKAIVFVISDFMMPDNYEQTLKIVGKKHDVTGIRVYDMREEKLPNVGFIQVLDAETQELMWVNTNSKLVRTNYEKNYDQQVQFYKDTFSRSGAGVVHTRVDESYVKKLLGYFKSR
jgi:hypothetical protein